MQDMRPLMRPIYIYARIRFQGTTCDPILNYKNRGFGEAPYGDQGPKIKDPESRVEDQGARIKDP